MKTKAIALLALIFSLCLVNYSIYNKEQLIEHGRVVYLALAPVDPRSLMQGDYMALRFAMANEINAALYSPSNKKRLAKDKNHNGYAVVTADANQVAVFKSVYAQRPLGEDEFLMRYRLRNGNVKFATNAFFFQEGHAEYYEQAKYGGFRVADDGELLLVSLHDENLDNLAPR